MPKVSVGLHCYNGSRWIDECIKSITLHLFDDVEHLLYEGVIGFEDCVSKVVEEHIAGAASILLSSFWGTCHI